MDWDWGAIFGWSVWIGGFVIVILVVIYIMWDAASKREDRRVITEQYAAILEPIVKYAGRYDSGLQTYVQRLRATASDAEHVTKEIILMSDIIALIRAIVLPKDQISNRDAELLRVFCWKSSMHQFDNAAPYIFSKAIVEARPLEGFKGFTALVALHAQDASDAQELTQIYLDLAKAIAAQSYLRSGNRAVGLRAVENEFYSVFKVGSPVSIIPDDLPSNDDEIMPHADNDRRFELLGLDKTATLDEIKSAYRTRVALWHPDRLHGMAPELLQAANDHLAKLNEAYQSLSSEYEV